MEPVNLQGQIKRYKGNGRRLGYPTANLDVDTDLKDGVYFGYADLKDWQHWPAIIFVGVPVTVGDTLRRVEAYLFDIPDEDYYDEQLSLSVESFHRENQNFASVDELLVAMKDDETKALEWFDSQA